MSGLTYDDVSVGLIGMAYQLRGQKPEDINDSMVTAWLYTLDRNQFSQKEFALACACAVDRGTFFPAVGEFMTPVLRLRPGVSLIHDPVVTGTNEFGIDCLESRARANRLGLEYREMHDKAPMLPGSDEQLDLGKSRLENLPITELARAKRVKAVDLLASDKHVQALPEPTAEEIEARRQALREQVKERSAS